MIIYNEDVTFDKFVDFEEYSKIFGNGIGGVTDEEVWEIARNFEEIPIFNNIYYSLLLGRAIDRYLENFEFLNEENFNIYINDTDTHFDYIDNDRNIKYSIKNDFEDFEEQLEENKFIYKALENFKNTGDLKDLLDLRIVIEEDFFEEKNIELTEKNYNDVEADLIDFLNEKYKFIDIPKNVLEDILYNDYGENLKEIGAKVGYEFIVSKEKRLKNLGIELEDTGNFVEVDGKKYRLYCGKTFEDSQKLDEVLDSGKHKVFRFGKEGVKLIKDDLGKVKEEKEKYLTEKTRDTVSQEKKEVKKKENSKKKVKKKSKGLSM